MAIDVTPEVGLLGEHIAQHEGIITCVICSLEEDIKRLPCQHIECRACLVE